VKELLLLRHAKSSWDNLTLADHDRPLNTRGKADAPRMGELLRQHELLPDLITGSTALRALKTAQAVADAAGYEGEITLSRLFFHADPETYLELLQELSDDVSRVLVVGHNPGLEELVELLTGEFVRLPTAALVWLQLPIPSWQALDDDTEATLVQVWRPRELGD
jgi:phosphohistidine phosphatase